MSELIILIYRLLTSLIVWPLSLAVRNHPNFKNTISQRLALTMPPRPAGDLIWFHGASLGEIKALAGLIETLKQQKPQTVICLSTMTATGRQAAKEIKGVDIVIPQPFDVRRIMKRYMCHLAPKALVIAETEIWPNMIMAAGASHVPVIIINARLSTKAFKRYLYVKPLIRHLLAYTRILAMGSRDYLRFKALGADNVSQADNIKFDAVTTLKGERADTLKKELAIGNRPVFIAGSIRSGEEALVVASIEEIRKNIPEVFCIVAPRHHDRISFVTCAATDRGMTWSLRSEGAA
ncbi:MAG TPA: glycosyltransferase N-terminal domain-containing protein, partial [Smithellaceae bacterium]|nr:glycosyltransferase N-terminal domain-containing protein [Smithellaceae bacterium]